MILVLLKEMMAYTFYKSYASKCVSDMFIPKYDASFQHVNLVCNVHI